MSEQLPEKIVLDAYVNSHSHIREDIEEDDQYVQGALLSDVIAGGADVVLTMTNTKKGVMTANQAWEYRHLAECWVSEGQDVTILPTMIVNEETNPEEIDKCADLEILDVKLLPKDRTTNSFYGVRHYIRTLPVIKRCGEKKVRVHFHPEHPWMEFDSRDAEYQFLAIADIFLNETEAEIFWEHGTDSRCIPFWKKLATSGRFFVGLTGHHLATNDDDTFGDVRATCKPPIKTERDRMDLVRLVMEDHPWVIYGPDDAPHPIEAKHVHEGKCACGAATSKFQLQLAAHALPQLLVSEQGREIFQNFTSRNARRIFNLGPAARKVTLVREAYHIPRSYKAGTWTVEPFWAGRTLDWSLKQ